MELGVPTCMHMRPLVVWNESGAGRKKRVGEGMSAGARNPHTSTFWSRTPESLSILYQNLAFQVVLKVCLLR